MARPIPDSAPVTTTTLPSIRIARSSMFRFDVFLA
jgi:hypothetical protein